MEKSREEAGNTVMRNYVNLYSSPNFLLLIKSRGTMSAGQLACMRDNVDLMRETDGKSPTEKLML
jgi:hypothetical protein